MVMQIKTRILELMAKKQSDMALKEGKPIRLSMTQLAEDTKISRVTLARWVKGEVTRFDEETVIKLCQYFDCDLCDLLYIEV